jgi:phosphoenolpyruvate carboxylase
MSRLVIEPEANLMKTKLGRLQAARLMRIVHRLRAQSRKRTVERLAETFIEQLVEIAPSLEALARKVPPKRARKQNTEKLGLPTKLSEDVFTSPPEH